MNALKFMLHAVLQSHLGVLLVPAQQLMVLMTDPCHNLKLTGVLHAILQSYLLNIRSSCLDWCLWVIDAKA